MGELHLEIIVDRLLREFKVEANVGKPQVAYRERPGHGHERRGQSFASPAAAPMRTRSSTCTRGRLARLRVRQQDRRRRGARSTSRPSIRASRRR
ncbi:MAG: hypothetical protein ACLSDQ_08635 [Adlercreutzia equolifaciens]